MMQTLRYTTKDKSDWPHGQDEPDKVQWPDPATGLPCLVVRNYVGCWCGYVGVPPGHPLHGLSYSRAEVEADLTVHGGLTFADGCGHGDEATGVCHKPDPGEPDDVWWLGFDCAHLGDLIPDRPSRLSPFANGTYRDLAYVQAECAVLAAQIAAQKPQT
jgi:hypothetical protein